MMTDAQEKELPPKVNLKTVEVAEFLNVSLATVYEMIHDGGLPCVKLGRIYRIPREAFVQWLNKKESDAAEQSRE